MHTTGWVTNRESETIYLIKRLFLQHVFNGVLQMQSSDHLTAKGAIEKLKLYLIKRLFLYHVFNGVLQMCATDRPSDKASNWHCIYLIKCQFLQFVFNGILQMWPTDWETQTVFIWLNTSLCYMYSFLNCDQPRSRPTDQEADRPSKRAMSVRSDNDIKCRP